jgi:hypothetical protein
LFSTTQVRAIGRIHQQALVRDRDRPLALHIETVLSQFLRQASAIRAFQQARAEMAMDLHGARENAAAQFPMQ